MNATRPSEGTPMSSAPQSPQALAALCGELLPLPPRTAHEPVFAAPWQAHAFAMTVHLHAQGLFTWPEWAAALSAQIHGHPLPADTGGDDGSAYYTHWLDALEQLILAKQVGTPTQIHALEHAWEAAAERTPHGQPIMLAPDELARLVPPPSAPPDQAI